MQQTSVYDFLFMFNCNYATSEPLSRVGKYITNASKQGLRPCITSAVGLWGKVSCVLGTNGETSCRMTDRLCTIYLLSGLAASFLWVYYSRLVWTEWSSPRHTHSMSRRSCQAYQTLWQTRWPLSVIKYWSRDNEYAHVFTEINTSYRLKKTVKLTGGPSVSAQ